jgi:hypothetical protein
MKHPHRTLVSLALALPTLLAAPAALAADTSCQALLKAVAAGLAQPRIHAAIDVPLDAQALKAGLKPTLVHSIVIDRLQYSNAANAAFSRVPLAGEAERDMASDLAVFQPDVGCKDAGGDRVAGRAARVTSFSVDLGRGEARVKVWVDAGSGLPVRAVTDEPDVDVDTVFDKQPGGKIKVQVNQKANGKRIVATHAYVYGDAVKPPTGGRPDAAAVAQLQALLKGAP